MNTASYAATIRVPQSQHHTIWSGHIEQPKKRFIVEFDSAGYVNVLILPTRIDVSLFSPKPRKAPWPSHATTTDSEARTSS